MMGLEPFFTVENRAFTEFTKYDNRSHKIFMKYFDLLPSRVEDEIRRLSLKQFVSYLTAGHQDKLIMLVFPRNLVLQTQ